jgi:hypothetical protein
MLDLAPEFVGAAGPHEVAVNSALDLGEHELGYDRVQFEQSRKGIEIWQTPLVAVLKIDDADLAAAFPRSFRRDDTS